ncbi:MAG: hypothetical protein KF912_15125 [Phycisphaeraceae bacterium]|nr:hypothetical protein [Phycisphaeraceae bacterium]MBX3368639.1 hypothetical protein [Phycisphaeraceae bacterium]
MTARHVVESLTHDGSRFGLNDRYVRARVVSAGREHALRDGPGPQDADILEHRLHDWALVSVDRQSPYSRVGLLAGSGTLSRGARLYAIGYEPRVPGGGLSYRPLRLAVQVQGQEEQAVYIMRNDGSPIEPGWSGAFIGRALPRGEWEFVAVIASVLTIRGHQYVTAVRPPREVISVLFDTHTTESDSTSIR